VDIKLVDVKEHDLELIRNWRNSEEVSRYMYTSNQITSEQQLAWFSKIQNDPTQKYWLIEYDNIKLGLVSIYNIKQDFKHCSWAFYLGNTEVRGAGIGSKVEYTILNYVFETMKFNKLMCEVFSFNEKVIQMHKKFGFQQEGFFREHILKDGKYFDVVALAILKSQWDLSKGKIKESIYNRVI
jgi:UDP-4-amino-4,6-dideoxy-N-acetyl-beta-L-altrosamine N-acetyltransferase